MRGARVASFNGTGGADIFTGGIENDLIVGNGGGDQLSGSDGDDTIFSDRRDDGFTGGLGRGVSFDIFADKDILTGGAGDDYFFAGLNDDVDGGVQGSYGNRLFISFMGAEAGVSADFRLIQSQGFVTIGNGTIRNIQNIGYLEGSNFDDFLVPIDTYYPSGANVFGRGGNDTILADYYSGWGGSGLYGGEGNDTIDARVAQYGPNLYGEAGDDTLYTSSNGFSAAFGGDGNDTIYAHGRVSGGDGDDLIVLQQSYYTGIVQGDAGNDEIHASATGHIIGGGAGADRIIGDSGADRIYSGDINENGVPVDDAGREHDILTGGGGDDRFYAGIGDDVDGGDGSDMLALSLLGAQSGVTFDTTTIAAQQPFTYAGGTIQNVETLHYLRGSDFADNLTLAAQASLLTVEAGDGDDVIRWGASSVAVYGSNGNDRFVNGIAGDSIYGGLGVDTLDYSQFAGGISVTMSLTVGQAGSGTGGDSIYDVENVDGTGFADAISGSNLANTLNGAAGDDTLNGYGGDDILVGGAGNDTLNGGTGNDTFYVESAGDVVLEANGEGSDRVIASLNYALATGSAVERLEAADASATTALQLTGNEFGNVIIGNAGNNVLTGGGGDDALAGAGGDDMLIGGTGNDSFFVDSTTDVVIENQGEGIDRIAASVSLTLEAGQSIERLEAIVLSSTDAVNFGGNEIANTIVGNNGVNVLDGRAGNDDLIGAGGNDVLIGGTGNDAAYGGSGDDVIYVDSAGDTVFEAINEGNDRVVASANFGLQAGSAVERIEAITLTAATALNLTGNEFAQSIIGNEGANVLDGGAGNDELVALGGNDALIGGAGRDLMYGGAGDDVYFVDTADEVFEGSGEGFDRVLAYQSYALKGAAQIEQLEAVVLSATTAMNLTGNELPQTIVGNNGTNLLDGGGGDDTLVSLAGDDVLIGGSGIDHMEGGLGNDTYYVDNAADRIAEFAGEGVDRVATSVSYTLATQASVERLEAITLTEATPLNLTGNELSQVIVGNAGSNLIDGGASGDELYGYSGDDVLIGGGGADGMIGGLGNDVFYVDDTSDAVFELAGQGTDRVATSVSYTLQAGSEVERLEFVSLGSTFDANLTGNEFANVLVGNNGANILDGRGGNDVLIGLGEADRFAFTTALGAGNVDRIEGFQANADKILLDLSVFSTLSAGGLAADAFVNGTAALDADDRILLDGARLLYDADGNGAGAAIQFASLSAVAGTITASDFIVI